MSSLLDELNAKREAVKSNLGPLMTGPSIYQPIPQLDDNAQFVYDKMQELHPGERIEVEHWTIMRVYNEHGLCIDVRRSINA